MSSPPLVEVLLTQRQAWQRGERPPLEALLADHPHLAADPDAVLDLIYNEVLLREQAGERPRLDDYLSRFPHLAEDLRVQFEVDESLTALRPPIPSTVPAPSGAGHGEALPRLEGVDLLDELGRGAMGVVYRGWQRGAKRPVAVKLLSDEMPAARVRNEVQAASRLQHPNIVSVYEVKEHEGRTALVLEYVEGGSLAQKLGGKPQPPLDAAHVVEVLAWAMAYAHDRGVIHRDLKPSNVLLSGGPDAPLARCQPKVGDFGLAKLLEESAHLTRTSDILGTPSYMAPEQAGAGGEIGPATDVYALGALLYECLTGRPPFVGQGMLDTLEQVRNRDPVGPRALNPAVPRDLETICLKCLQKGPARRFGSAQELAEDLRRFQAGEPIRARSVGVVERAWKWARRRPSAALLVVGLVLGTLLLAVGGVVVGDMLRRERNVAVREAEERKRQLRVMQGLLYTAQLLRVGALRDSDPAQGLRMLEDPDACPPELRCFSWGVLYGLCRPYRTAHVRHTRPVSAFAASADGKLFATGATGGEVRVWDAAGRSKGGWEAKGGRVTALALSKDGALLAAATEDGKVTVWEVDGARPLGDLTVPAGVAFGLAFHPDSRLLAVNGGNARTGVGSVALWDLRQMRPRRTFRNETNATSGVAVAADGTQLAVANRDEAVVVWDTRTGRLQTELRGHSAPVRAIAFHPDGRSLAAGAGDGLVKLWNIARGAEIDGLSGAVGAVVGIAFHPTDPLIALAGAGGQDAAENPPDVQVWDLTARRGREPLRGHGGAAGVAFIDAGKGMLTAGADRALKRWDHPGALRGIDLPGLTGDPNTTAATPNGRVLAWITRGERPTETAVEVAVHDEARLVRRASIPGRGRGLRCLAVAADGQHVVTGSGEPGKAGELVVWNTRVGREVQFLPAPASMPVALALSPDGKRLLTATEDGTVRLLGLEGGTELWARPLGVRPAAVAFSSDGRTVAAAGGRTLAAWGSDGMEKRRVALSANAGCVALGPAGRVAAAGGPEEGTAVLVEVDGDGEAVPLDTGMKGLAHLAFSPDGLTLAAAGAGGAVKLWDVRSRQERAGLAGHRGGACFVAFGGDGRLLLSVARSREVRLWHRRGE